MQSVEFFQRGVRFLHGETLAAGPGPDNADAGVLHFTSHCAAIINVTDATYFP